MCVCVSFQSFIVSYTHIYAHAHQTDRHTLDRPDPAALAGVVVDGGFFPAVPAEEEEGEGLAVRGDEVAGVELVGVPEGVFFPVGAGDFEAAVFVCVCVCVLGGE